MITIKQSGSFKNTFAFFNKVSKMNTEKILKKYGEIGVQELQKATPKDTGYTASCWGYKIVKNKDGYSIVWTNSNVVNGIPIAVIIQYGHATRNGGYVQGVDYINPALKPIFEKLSNDVWKEVRP